jgi:Fe-S cluster assembly ATP-binding protein
MLIIKNLHVTVAGEPILNGLNLEIPDGEIHALMGPNGAGKSTLSNVLAGHPAYTITQGSINFNGHDLLAMSPDERARAGLFLSFQYPVEIPGVTNINFLKASVNAVRTSQNKEPLDALKFLSFIREKCQKLAFDEGFLYRNLNEGFSGGEKKRNEMLQFLALEPKLALLDETDSGLDIDALRLIADAVNSSKAKDRAILLVTHYQRLLDYIKPDKIHVLYQGKIVKSGDASLALKLEEQGYAWLEEA